VIAAPAATSARCRTGIALLDERLRGGFPRPSTLLFFSEKPTEKRLFAEHFAVEGARNGETVLYVDFFRAPQLARREFTAFGPFPPERLVFVDAISSQLLLPSDEPYRIADIADLTGILDTIVRAIEESRPARIIVDSMEYLADRFPRDDVLAGWRRLIDAAQAVGSVICFLFINWTFRDAELATVRAMSDFVVEFQTSMRGGIVRNTMRVSEVAESGVKTNWIPYTFKDFIGVTVYFPRILVTGPFNAGKSTVVRSLSTKSVSVDRMGTTVAFDYGNVNVMGIEAEVFGTPGQERFEFIFKIFAREVSGILLVVDATRPEDFPRARAMLDLVGERVPYVVLANKSDLPGALPTAEIAHAMGLADDVPILSTVATEDRGVKDALLILAEMIMGVR
jgi:hypothetical protein